MKKSERDKLYCDLPRLKPSIKKRWLAALRSGEYKQGQAALCNTNKEEGKTGFCCLGVLCDVVKGDKAVKVDWKFTPYDDGSPEGYWEFGGADSLPPDVVMNYLFADPLLRGWDDNFALDPLVTANDGNAITGVKPHTFKQIAAIIEEYM